MEKVVDVVKGRRDGEKTDTFIQGREEKEKRKRRAVDKLNGVARGAGNKRNLQLRGNDVVVY